MPEETKPDPALKPEKKSDWRLGRHPLSVRIREPEKVKFMEALIAEKGNSQAALDHCVTAGMTVSGEVGAHIKEISRLEKENKELQRQLSLKPTAGGGFAFDEPETNAIAALRTKKGLADDHATVKYALTYTLKNAWL
jgi:hypothetical protein